MRRLMVVFFSLFAFAVQPALAGAADMLHVPFAVPAAGIPGAEPASCATPAPDPVVTLDLTSRYDPADPTHSTVDPDKAAAYDDALAPARRYLIDLSHFANAYVAGGKAAKAACAIAWLRAWADADALTGWSNRQTGLSVTRILSGVALSYAQVKRSPAGNETDRVAIDGWLQGLAAKTQALFADDSARSSDENNHRYWGGLAVAAVAVATGDKAGLDWAVASYRLGVCQVTPDGTLPLEMARASRARDYHLHALTPLVMIAALGEANGRPLFSACGGALKRLAAFAARSVTTPADIEKRAGAPQVDLPRLSDGAVRSDRIAWVDIYERYDPGNAAVTGIPVDRPLKNSNLGGDMTLLFAGKSADSL